MAARLRLLIAGVAAAALLGNGCIQKDGTRSIPLPSFGSVDSDDEAELGYAFDLEAQKELPLIYDLLVLEFIQDLGQQMVERLGEQPFDYRFRVVDHPELNAFAVPGGYIYLHTATILQVNGVEELVGVLAHELAHVKGRHYARTREATAIPSLLTQLAAVGAAAATGEVAPLLAAQGANVALELKFTRQFEDEADRVGAVFMTRSGYDPMGMARFFERIIAAQGNLPPGVIPPYLYSHPDAEQRIEVVSALAEQLRPVGRPPDLDARLRRVQDRLAWLAAKGRASDDTVEPYDRSETDPRLATAAALVETGARGQALEVLAEAEAIEPLDPRVPFRRGDLFESLGRTDDAIAAYARAVELDPNHASVFQALARAHLAAGHKSEAIFFLEQASWRAKTSRVRERTRWEIERLVFPVVAESGFADGRDSESSDTVAGTRRLEFGANDDRLAWWARIGPHWLGSLTYARVRWIDPAGREQQSGKPHRHQRVWLSTEHDLGEHPPAGIWRLELQIGDRVVHEASVAVVD